jgi:hypothetical protein
VNAPEYSTVREALIGGFYDENLKDLSAAINERMSIRRSFMEFGVGDRVVLNDRCRTKYLHGSTAVVVETLRKNVKIVLDKPIGRFSTPGMRIRVPTSILDPA